MTYAVKAEASSNISPQEFTQRVLSWYHQHGRKDLPWQKNITPYRVWISEIMLQQTQVATVIPYFAKFMKRFPSLKSLAEAPVDDVLSHWSGLGYYARARNLHKCAQTVVSEFAGRFPKSVDELETLPGIGRSTAGAIATISMGLSAPILDGNVKRVLARHFAVEGWPGKTAVHNALWDIAEAHTPDSDCNHYTQAMMDLGATLCTRTKPDCKRCPLVSTCIAEKQNRQLEFPGKKPKVDKPVKQSVFLIIQSKNGNLLLEQRPPQGIWGGLWSFLEQPLNTPINADLSPEEWLDLAHPQLQSINLKIDSVEIWPGFRHTFSHYHLDIYPLLITLESPPNTINEKQQQWLAPAEALELGLAAPVTKLLKRLSNHSGNLNLF
ncbi:A/G-specific adenine glycosylase [Sessilibacter corallicola]|uniref:Adenine DNA glycosylase n=1 Tax=Sessilibacter corallicola TaxID=2904075 RepID=A0ABQ0A8F1_9GAMM